MANDNKRPRSDQDEGADWKTKSPYAATDGQKDRKALHAGSCHCKAVTFNVYNTPLDAHYCHCDVCQKLHGAVAHWSCIMDKGNVLFTCSPDKLDFYRTEDQRTVHELPCKISCKTCHAPICDEGRNKILMYPSLFDFADKHDREPFLPQKHIFYSMRCVDVHDGMTKWTKMAKKSEKMDEGDHHGETGIAGDKRKLDSSA